MVRQLLVTSPSSLDSPSRQILTSKSSSNGGTDSGSSSTTKSSLGSTVKKRRKRRIRMEGSSFASLLLFVS